MKLTSLLGIFAATGVFLWFLRAKLTQRQAALRKRREYFKGKVVWITGASSGIGESLAYELYRCGAKLILSARRQGELERVKQQCKSLSVHSAASQSTAPAEPVIVLLDLSDPLSVQEAARHVLAQFRHVDVLINNSGISTRSAALETLPSVEERVMRINFFGTVELTKAVLPGMIANKAGHIAVVSSVQGKLGVPFRSAYSASKHALHGYFDSLRAEVASSGVAITLACPGYVKTNLSLNALTGSGQTYGVMDETTAKGYAPEYVATRTLDGMVAKKPELLIAALDATLGVYLRCFAPGLLAKIMSKRAAKQAATAATTSTS